MRPVAPNTARSTRSTLARRAAPAQGNFGATLGPSRGGADTSTILERHLGPPSEVRVVHGCTALALFPDATAALRATMGLLGEASRTSGSATAGAHVTGRAHDEIGPDSGPVRAAAALAHLADANRLLVTSDLLAAISPVRGSTWSFDPAPRRSWAARPS